jgi:hypothetical protein
MILIMRQAFIRWLEQTNTGSSIGIPSLLRDGAKNPREAKHRSVTYGWYGGGAEGAASAVGLSH